MAGSWERNNELGDGGVKKMESSIAIALLQERFKQLERVKDEMRQKRDLLTTNTIFSHQHQYQYHQHNNTITSSSISSSIPTDSCMDDMQYPLHNHHHHNHHHHNDVHDDKEMLLFLPPNQYNYQNPPSHASLPSLLSSSSTTTSSPSPSPSSSCDDNSEVSLSLWPSNNNNNNSNNNTNITPPHLQPTKTLLLPTNEDLYCISRVFQFEDHHHDSSDVDTTLHL